MAMDRDCIAPFRYASLSCTASPTRPSRSNEAPTGSKKSKKKNAAYMPPADHARGFCFNCPKRNGETYRIDKARAKIGFYSIKKDERFCPNCTHALYWTRMWRLCE